MADDKYAKSKYFILSPDGYEEITYSELCRRRDTDIHYQERKFVPLHGMLMEVTPEPHKEQTAVSGQTVGRKRRYRRTCGRAGNPQGNEGQAHLLPFSAVRG